jgi:hypothetical protein
MSGVRTAPPSVLSGGPCDYPHRRTGDAPTRPVNTEAVAALPPEPAVRTQEIDATAPEAISVGQRRRPMTPGRGLPSPPHLPTPLTRFRRLVSSRDCAAARRSMPARCASAARTTVGGLPDAAPPTHRMRGPQPVGGSPTSRRLLRDRWCARPHHFGGGSSIHGYMGCVPSSNGSSSERFLVKNVA